MRQLTDNELDQVSGGLEGDDITVTGHRFQDIDWWMLGGGGGGGGLGGLGGGGYGGGGYGGGLGGGGGGVGGPYEMPPQDSDNFDFPVTNDDAATEDAAAFKASSIIANFVASEGNFEFCGLLQQNLNGTFGLAGNEISTSFMPGNCKPEQLSDYSHIYGAIHNHVWNDDYMQSYMNFVNRFPSNEDWEYLDELVSPKNGAISADPSKLSIFILDPWGDLREYHYSDKSTYYNLWQ